MDKVLIICGPTGVGKTKLSIKLAKYFNGEIINVDSMQVYKQMNIGTAKIKEEEKDGVPHHLFDIFPVTQTNNIADFQKLVREKIKEVKERNHLPILVGGTGLYVKATVYDYDFVETKTETSKYILSDEKIKTHFYLFSLLTIDIEKKTISLFFLFLMLIRKFV